MTASKYLTGSQEAAPTAVFVLLLLPPTAVATVEKMATTTRRIEIFWAKANFFSNHQRKLSMISLKQKMILIFCSLCKKIPVNIG